MLSAPSAASAQSDVVIRGIDSHQFPAVALTVSINGLAPSDVGRIRLAENGDGITDEDRVVERLSQDDIVTALSAVPHDFRDVVVLVDLGDFSYADAAQILDIPVGTVMSRLHRGRRILKRELAESALEEAT